MFGIIVFTMMVTVLAGCYLVPGTPEAAFHDFQTTQHKESFIVAPLCGAGEKVVPLVTRKITDRDLDRRGYAIMFLGATESKIPVDALESIVIDESEKDGFRDNALKSLFMIDENRGRAAALRFRESSGYLGQMANNILAVENHSEYKSRESACLITD